ncbi:MAG: hypothetical protein ACP5NF_02725 [Thermoanaerobaculum sp.]
MATRFWQLAAVLFVLVAGVVFARFQEVLSPAPLVLLAFAALWLATFALAAFGAGSAVARLVPPCPPLAAAVLTLALGLGVLAALAMGLGLVGLLNRWALMFILLFFLLFGGYRLSKFLAPGTWKPRPLPSLWLLVLPFVFFSFLSASVPSAFYDQLNYHLAFPFQWLRQGGLTVFPRHDYSYLPANMGLLFTYALAFLPDWTAQLVHWGVGALAAASAVALARSLGASGLWAGVLFAATPAVVLSASWAASDLGAAAFAGACWLAILAATEEPAQRWRWVLAGTLSGLAAGCKLLSLATVVAPGFLAVALVPFVLGEPRKLERAFFRAALFAFGVFLSLGPWLGRNVVLTGNPLHPVFSGSPVGGGNLLAGGEVSGVWETLAKVGRKVLAGLFLGTFDPRGAAGVVGPVYLALLPATLRWVWRFRDGKKLLLLAGFLSGVVAWGLVFDLPRYLLGALVPGAALMGAFWESLLESFPRAARRALVVLVGGGILWGAMGSLAPEFWARVGVALGQMGREEWLARSVDYWSAAQFVNSRVDAGGKVLLVAEARSMYFERTVVVEDPFHTPLLVELADHLPDARALTRSLRAMGVTHCLVNWREAERMAALNHRERYFEPQTQRGAATLREFVELWLERVFQDGAVEVYRVKDPLPLGGTP